MAKEALNVQARLSVSLPTAISMKLLDGAIGQERRRLPLQGWSRRAAMMCLSRPPGAPARSHGRWELWKRRSLSQATYWVGNRVFGASCSIIIGTELSSRFAPARWPSDDAYAVARIAECLSGKTRSAGIIVCRWRCSIQDWLQHQVLSGPLSRQKTRRCRSVGEAVGEGETVASHLVNDGVWAWLPVAADQVSVHAGPS